MKRVNFIVRGKGVLTNMLDRNIARINRAVKSAIGSVNDDIDELDTKIEDAINDLGKDPKDSDAVNQTIDHYIALYSDRKVAHEALEALEALKAKLDEDVEVEEEEK